MSREQLTDQQAEQGTASSATTTTEVTYGLPAPLYAQIKSLRYGDAEGLAALLASHQEFTKNILGVASSHVGLAAVKRAMAMSKQSVRPGAITQEQMRPGGEFALEGDAPAGPSVVRPGVITQEQMRPGGEFALEGDAPAGPSVVRPGAITQEQMRPGGEFALEGNAPAAPSVVRPGAITQEQMRPGGEFELEGSAAPAPKAEAPWVAGARKYNDAHAELVSEFNELTKYKCALDDGLIDPQAVAHWQRQHGLEPDGKVGPHTLAAARHAVAKAGPAGGSADARIPV